MVEPWKPLRLNNFMYDASSFIYRTLLIKRFLQQKKTCDWFGAGGAALGEQFAEAGGAVRLFVFGGEALAGQAGVAVHAAEALLVPRLVLVRHAPARNHLEKRGGTILLAQNVSVACVPIIVVIQ